MGGCKNHLPDRAEAPASNGRSSCSSRDCLIGFSRRLKQRGCARIARRAQTRPATVLRSAQAIPCDRAGNAERRLER